LNVGSSTREENSLTSSEYAWAVWQLERRAIHKLAVLRHAEEVTGNVSATCRCYGVSRQACYHWLRRLEADDAEGLRDGCSAPRSSPTATNVEVVEEIVWPS